MKQAKKKQTPKSRRALLFAGAVAVGVASYAIYARVAADGPVRGDAAVASAALAPVSAAPMTGHGQPGPHGRHPAPRPGVGPEKVDDPAKYDDYPRIASVYRAAAENPQLLDGLYCYCNCAEHAGHYSLLECYSSDHAAKCDVCLSEAEMAFKAHRQGVGLDGIRSVIDQFYGS